MGSLIIYGAGDGVVNTSGDLVGRWESDSTALGANVRVGTSVGVEVVRVSMSPVGTWVVNHVVQLTGSTMAVSYTHGEGEHVATDAEGDDETATLTTAGAIEWVEVILVDSSPVPPGRMLADGTPSRTDDDGTSIEQEV